MAKISSCVTVLLGLLLAGAALGAPVSKMSLEEALRIIRRARDVPARVLVDENQALVADVVKKLVDLHPDSVGYKVVMTTALDIPQERYIDATTGEVKEVPMKTKEEVWNAYFA